jgi:hypothetical protein
MDFNELYPILRISLKFLSRGIKKKYWVDKKILGIFNESQKGFVFASTIVFYRYRWERFIRKRKKMVVLDNQNKLNPP